MDSVAKTTLQQIGAQLDQHIFPLVKNGGIVAPTDATVPLTVGQEKHHVARQQARRSTTRPRQGTAGREGPAGGPGPSRQASSFVSANLRDRYEAELDAVRRAYPGAHIWSREDEVWLLTESSLLPGLRQAAVFLTVVSYSRLAARGWGFWNGLAGPVWIGPRHTNFPDGSICAFALADGTWTMGDPLVSLLDLYSLWALRHLHYREFGRWPGAQEVSYPYERLTELRADELCGCGSDALYGDCCQEHDLRRDRIADAVYFLARTSGGYRNPPQAVITSVRDGIAPPSFDELLAQYGS